MLMWPGQCLIELRRQLVRLWEATQVELHGRYSVNRMQSLQAYAQKTSLSHVLFVASVTPLPCLAAVAIADSIPLKPIELGLAHSQGFWIRAVFAVVIYSVAAMEQLKHFIPALPITNVILLSVTSVATSTTVLGTYALALLIGYPLPFAVPMLLVPWATSLFLAVGFFLRKFIWQHPAVVREIIQFILIAICQLSLVIVYPAYTFFFVKLSSHSQTAFALLLPVIKLVEKNLISFFLRNLDDLKPEIIIFNVEIFNALFISCCMQNANSIGTNLVLVVVDFIMACGSLHDLEVMLSHTNRLAYKMGLENVNIIDTAMEIADQFPDTERLISSLMNNERRSQRSLSIMKVKTSRGLRRSQVKPLSLPTLPTMELLPNSPDKDHANTLIRPPSPTKVRIHQQSAPERRIFVRQTLQILHMTEYVLLIEYTEVMIPIVYSLYLVILFWLPNRAYYPQLKDMDYHRLRATIGNVMMNATLELVSLVLLSLVLRRKLHVSPLHQLGFVLQTQWRVVQSKLIHWMVITVQSSLIHVGTDYTFKFAWLQKRLN